jgi:hypothetical protein
MMLVGEQANEDRLPGISNEIDVVRVAPGWAAVMIADSAAENVPALAVNDPETVPAGTVTDAGTAKDGLLLTSEMIAPPGLAGAVRVTVHAVLLKAKSAASEH